MKKLFLMTMIASLLVLAGCSIYNNKSGDTQIDVETAGPEASFDPAVYLQNLPDHPDKEDMPVCIYCELRNPGDWDEFAEEVEKGNEADVTFANITIEGDPIYTYLTFDGDRYLAVTDTSHDKFGQPETYYSTRKYLYQIVYETEEETNGGIKPFENHLTVLSDEVFESDEDVIEAFHREGNELVYLWGFSKVKE